jgi:hypothetical protein
MSNIFFRAEITLTPALSRNTGRGGQTRSATNRSYTPSAGGKIGKLSVTLSPEFSRVTLFVHQLIVDWKQEAKK